MRWQDSICVVPPPQIQTVKKTNSRVVENIIWRAYVAVSLMESAKVIAPRRPEESSTENESTNKYASNDLCSQACKSHALCRPAIWPYLHRITIIWRTRTIQKLPSTPAHSHKINEACDYTLIYSLVILRPSVIFASLLLSCF